eukprot:260129-Chlamydomonas_euryale.AAC.4
MAQAYFCKLNSTFLLSCQTASQGLGDTTPLSRVHALGSTDTLAAPAATNSLLHKCTFNTRRERARGRAARQRSGDALPSASVALTLSPNTRPLLAPHSQKTVSK